MKKGREKVCYKREMKKKEQKSFCLIIFEKLNYF